MWPAPTLPSRFVGLDVVTHLRRCPPLLHVKSSDSRRCIVNTAELLRNGMCPILSLIFSSYLQTFWFAARRAYQLTLDIHILQDAFRTAVVELVLYKLWVSYSTNTCQPVEVEQHAMWSKFLEAVILSGCLTQLTHAQSLPAPVTSGYSQTDLDRLWQSVEQGGVPVVKANVTRVLEPLANFSVGPEPPRFRPAYLQATTQNIKLPKGFLYGVSTAATQVEGAVKEGGRGPSNWDWGCHNNITVCNNEVPDVTVNEYYQYKQDIQRVKAMGVNAFSFSIAWARILPFGHKGSPVSEEGLQFYDNFIDELLKNGIEPVATLFHWDTPLNLMSQYGAFLNNSIVEDFDNYASIVFQRYGKKVKTWFTFNEPHVYCDQYAAYPYNSLYTGGINATTAPYTCVPNLIKAHAVAVQTYRGLISEGKIAKGKIALKHDGQRPIPFDFNSASDREVVERRADIYIGIFSQPIYVDGNYPKRVLDTIPASILRRFTDEEKKIIKGSADFYAIDSYATIVAKTPPNGIEACAANVNDPNWPSRCFGHRDSHKMLR
ncbi:hypothetical protein QCA50_013666 [Cerrena zonata]|uniref:Glycoside hydrolase family 1 protein n=1 Tax=Cerrena zonata TaxID=2478898 RepID=A0AAW0G0G7_9APHY